MCMFACLSSVCLCSYRLNLRYTSRQNMRYINDLYIIRVYSCGRSSLGDLQKFRNLDFQAGKTVNDKIHIGMT